MDNNFIDGFEKVAWTPIQGIGQVRRGLSIAASGTKRFISRSASKAKSGVGGIRANIKNSYNKGRHGVIQARTSSTKYAPGASSPFTKGHRPVVMRSEASTTLRSKRLKALKKANPKERAAHTKDRLADVRKKDFTGNLNPLQHKNTAAKVIAGGVAAGVGTGYVGHRMGKNSNPQRPQQRQMQQQQVMMRRRSY